MIMKRVVSAAAAAMMVPSAALAWDGASADPLATGSVAKVDIPHHYTSRVLKNGHIEVKLKDEPESRQKGRDVLTVFAPNMRTTERMLHTQEWFMVVGPNGAMRGVYTVPAGTILSSNVLRTLGEGYGILKIDPRSSLFKVFPSPKEMETQVQSFTHAARDAVCELDNKPEILNASLDVKPGWAGSGTIKFNATWKVSTLCAAVKAAKAAEK